MVAGNKPFRTAPPIGEAETSVDGSTGPGKSECVKAGINRIVATEFDGSHVNFASGLIFQEVVKVIFLFGWRETRRIRHSGQKD